MSLEQATYSRGVTETMQEASPSTTRTMPLAEARPGQHKGLNSWDVLGMAGGFLLCLGITYLISRGRIFWEDEMLGWMLLRDPSWRHMIAAWKLGADGGGFSFYLLGRGWFRLFGASDVSFRFFSATGFGLAFAITWAAARRYYSTGIVALALVNTWFFSNSLMYHMVEGRFYGLLVLCTALAFALGLVAAETREKVPATLYISLFLVHGLMTTSHLLGVVYSGFFVCAMVAVDWLDGRFRPALYLSAALSWLLLIPERTAMIASAQAGKPHFWTTQPTVKRFLGVYSGFSPEIATVLIGLALGTLFMLSRRPRPLRAELQAAYHTRRPVYVLMFALFLLPVVFTIEGRFATPLVNNRYMLPVIVGLAYATAELLELIGISRLRLKERHGGVAFASMMILVYCVFLVWWVTVRRRTNTPSEQNYTDALTVQFPKGIPVVCDDAFSFTELMGRQHDSGVRYTYLLDWPSSIAPGAAHFEAMQFHLMQNWKNAGYFSGSIEDIDEFLKTHDRFFVLHARAVHSKDVPDIGNPLTERFSQDPAYEVRPYSSLDRGAILNTAVLVCRGGCGKQAP